MFAQQRHEQIVGAIAAHGRVSVRALANEFDVAEETIRRDLDHLAAEGLLERVHGGAIGRRAPAVESSIGSRMVSRTEDKARIARAAAQFLPASGGAIVLDAGSSTHALTHLLPQSGLFVCTHAPAIALGAVSAGVREVHVLPGRVRPTTLAAVGAATVNALRDLNVDVAFLGCNGIDTGGFTTPDPEEAAVKNEIARRASMRVMLADSSKFRQLSLVRIATWEQIDVLVTDRELPADLATSARRHNTEVVLA